MTNKPVPLLAIQPCSTSAAFEQALLAMPRTGILYKLETGYVYLKISEAFIDELLPLIELPPTQRLVLDRRMDDVGAHISIVYPDEIQTAFEVPDLGKSIDFEIQGLSVYTATVHEKSYSVLLIKSVALEQLRISVHLGKEPIYHGVRVPFHITLASVTNV